MPPNDECAPSAIFQDEILSPRKEFTSALRAAALHIASNIHLFFSTFPPFCYKTPKTEMPHYSPSFLLPLLSENNYSECAGAMDPYDLYEPSLGVEILLSICYGVISLGAVVGE